MILAHSYVPYLAADRADNADDIIRQGAEEWPHEGTMASFLGLYGRAETALYRGEGMHAWDLIGGEEAALNRSTFFKSIQVRFILMIHLRARTALAASAAAAKGSFFSPRERLLRRAVHDAKRIERQRMPWSDPLEKLIRSGIANLRGRTGEAVSLLDAAEKELLTADMALYAAAARRQRGMLLGGANGQSLVKAADGFMTSQDIRNPARIAAMLAPGFAN
jgi:hypothetical protein